MGFVEETGAAQYLRDVRVTAIYEGTNGIQAMDLVARKMADGGEAAFSLLDEVEGFAETARETMPELAAPVWEAAETLREAVEWLVAQGDLNDRFAGSSAFLQGLRPGARRLLPPARGDRRTGRRPRAACAVLHHADAARTCRSSGPCPGGGEGSLCADPGRSRGMSDRGGAPPRR